MNLLQRYGDFGLIPRNWPDSCRSCCDKGMRLRQSRGKELDGVVYSIILILFFLSLRHNGGPEILVWRILEQGSHF